MAAITGNSASLPSNSPVISSAGELRSRLQEPLSVRCCTWNLGGASMEDIDDLAPLVAPDGAAADVIALGLQECVELNLWNIVFADDTVDPGLRAELKAKVSAALVEATGRRYEIVSTVGLVGLYIMVFVRQELFDQISEVECDRVKTGAMGGMFGNKGGVCVRFNVAQWELCFVNVHLASGYHNLAARCEDLGAIMNTAFQQEDPHGHERSRKPACGFFRNSGHSVSIHHATMIFGDFNFRLEMPDDLEWPIGEPSDWLLCDEWTMAQVDNLYEYQEGKVEFMPTYRYERGSSILDKKRIPAWCDRVLYRTMPGVAVKLLEYRSIVEMCKASDHQPVTALFQFAHEREETSKDFSIKATSSQAYSLLRRTGDQLKAFAPICCKGSGMSPKGKLLQESLGAPSTKPES